METRKTLKRASESSVFVLSCTKTSGDKSLSFICYNDISGKMHRDNWNGKILCLKRWISLQKCLWCAIYWWVIHRQVIVIKNYWHVLPSVNLWRHEKQKCDISGSTRHTKSIERRQYTTLLTLLSKYISLAILCNRALFTSRLPKKAEYLELCARQFHSKSTFWLTRLLRLEKERMRPSATPIIIFSITDSGRPTCVATLTTALARIKTIFFYGTWPGELWWTSITQSWTRSLLLATRNLDQIIALGGLKNHTNSPTYHLFTSWRALLKSQALLETTKPRSWELTMEESLFQCIRLGILFGTIL